MEQTKKRKAGKLLFLIPVGLLILALVILPFVLDKMSESENDGASIRSATVTRGDISRTVSGAGTIEAKDALELSVPEGVVLTGYLVSDGDLVKKGDPVASVDPVSVYKAAADLAETLESVTEELSNLQHKDSSRAMISASVDGTVTAIYAKTGDDVREIMQQYGALCEITTKKGTVIKVTATSGTIDWIYVREGSAVFNGNKLFSVADVDGSGSYASLVLKRRKIEDQIAQLFQMLRDGYAAAPGDGMITGTDESLVKELSAGGSDGLRVTLLADRTDASARVTLLSGTDPGGSQPQQQIVYLSGTLGEDGAVKTADGDVAAEGMDTLNPAPKPGDTIIIQNIFYTLDDIPLDDPAPQYIAVYAISSGKPDGGMPGGMGGDMGGGFGGGGGGFGGGSMSGASAEESEEPSLATTLIASVVPTDEVLVRVTIDELDILSLHQGDEAQVTIDALPGHAFTGVVTDVNTGLSNSGGNSKYTAEITLPLEENMLAGMNASCLVTVETFRDVLTVPAEAVRDEIDGPAIYTAVSRDGATLLQPVPVELGFSDGETVEILSGLSEGDTVWYSTYDTPEYSVPGSRSGGSGPRV